MSNITMAWKNWADNAVLANGSWSVDLPLSNIQVPYFSLVARSADATSVSTQLVADLGSPKMINLIGLLGHTMSDVGVVQIKIYSDSGLTDLLYDSGFISAIPVVWGPGSGGLWGVDPVWTGKYGPDELAETNVNFFHQVPGTIVARYVRIDITDSTNVIGYIDIARLFIGPSWEVTYNYNVGASLGWRDLSNVDEGISGAIFAEQRTRKRTFAFDFSFLSKNEVLRQAFDMQRTQGITKEIIVIPTPDDTTYEFQEAFMGRLKTLSPFQVRQAGLHDIGFEIEEIV